jgi:hypothetical protein
LSVPSKIVQDLDNFAIVTANLVTDTCKDIPVSKDSSGVKRLALKASVKIANTEYLGNDGGKKCGTDAAVELAKDYYGGKKCRTDAAVELAKDYYGANVNYCFEITNSGKSSVDSVLVEDAGLGFVDKSIGMLAPGATKMLSVGGTITAQWTNLANVTGNPCLDDGTDIPGMDDVTSADPSGVEMLPYIPSVDIVNTVYLHDNGISCGSATDYVEHSKDYPVTYCFKVTNKGNSYLNNVAIVEPLLSQRLHRITGTWQTQHLKTELISPTRPMLQILLPR